MKKREIKQEVIQAESNYRNYSSIIKSYSKEFLQRTDENLK